MRDMQTTFVLRNGDAVQGEVWSPGPAPRSMWVLLADGTTIATDEAGNELPTVPADPRGLVDNDHTRQAYRTTFRYAPRPRLREWARAVELFRVS